MDMITWRDACQVGLSAYMTDLNQAAEDRRARRHEISNTTPSGPCCPTTCNKVCAFDFGLRSSKSSPKSHSIVAQRLRRIDRQLQGKARHWPQYTVLPWVICLLPYE